MESSNVTPVESRAVSRAEREARQGHRAGVLWLTGLSGSGKSTIALAAERELFGAGARVYMLDGDNLRTGLCGDLGFGLDDRAENICRVAETARLFVSAGHLVLCSFVSPTQAVRDRACGIIGAADFHEVFVDADLATCERRDVKGLYARARRGEIRGFTGIDSPYEAPTAPSLVLPSASESVPACTEMLLTFARERFGVPAAHAPDHA